MRVMYNFLFSNRESSPRNQVNNDIIQRGRSIERLLAASFTFRFSLFVYQPR